MAQLSGQNNWCNVTIFRNFNVVGVIKFAFDQINVVPFDCSEKFGFVFCGFLRNLTQSLFSISLSAAVGKLMLFEYSVVNCTKTMSNSCALTMQQHL